MWLFPHLGLFKVCREVFGLEGRIWGRKKGLNLHLLGIVYNQVNWTVNLHSEFEQKSWVVMYVPKSRFLLISFILNSRFFFLNYCYLTSILTCLYSWNWAVFLNLNQDRTAQNQIIVDVTVYKSCWTLGITEAQILTDRLAVSWVFLVNVNTLNYYMLICLGAKGEWYRYYHILYDSSYSF